MYLNYNIQLIRKVKKELSKPFKYLGKCLVKQTFMKYRDNVRQSHLNEKSSDDVSEHNEN